MLEVEPFLGVFDQPGEEVLVAAEDVIGPLEDNPARAIGSGHHPLSCHKAGEPAPAPDACVGQVPFVVDEAPAPLGCAVVVVDVPPFVVVVVEPDGPIDEVVVVDPPALTVVEVDAPDAPVVVVDEPGGMVVVVDAPCAVVVVVAEGRVVVVVAGTSPGIRPFGLLVVTTVVLEGVGG